MDFIKKLLLSPLPNVQLRHALTKLLLAVPDSPHPLCILHFLKKLHVVW